MYCTARPLYLRGLFARRSKLTACAPVPVPAALVHSESEGSYQFETGSEYTEASGSEYTEWVARAALRLQAPSSFLQRPFVRERPPVVVCA